MNNKTPQYTKDAINRYNAKFDRIAVNLPKGTKERVKELTGMSCNAYISELVLKDLEQRENSQEIPIDTKARIYKNITGVDMPDGMRHEPEQVQVIQPEKSPDSVIFDGLELSPERAKEIQEKLDQQLKAKEEHEKQTPRKDSFFEKLEQLKKDNEAGRLALNVREDI